MLAAAADCLCEPCALPGTPVCGDTALFVSLFSLVVISVVLGFCCSGCCFFLLAFFLSFFLASACGFRAWRAASLPLSVPRNRHRGDEPRVCVAGAVFLAGKESACSSALAVRCRPRLPSSLWRRGVWRMAGILRAASSCDGSHCCAAASLWRHDFVSNPHLALWCGLVG